jgi:hypothetical protein
VQLHTDSGTLWITVDGRSEDILLAAGECRRFEGPAAVIAYALGGEARFRVGVGRPGSGGRLRRALRWPERLMAWLRGWWPGRRPAVGAGA